MRTLLLRRTGLGLRTVWLVSVLIFLGTQVLPGNSAQAILGKRATPERLAAMEAQLNLDAPIHELAAPPGLISKRQAMRGNLAAPWGRT